jgi:hypothetical protein
MRLAATVSSQLLETAVREALRDHLMASIAGAEDTVDEFWVPGSNERADIAVIGRRMDGFEIKTERDTLKRLPRQVSAYGRLFDRCTAVVAERHRADAEEILPDWWGLTTLHMNGAVNFTVVRRPRTNPEIDPSTLVRLLWRDEAMHALVELGVELDRRASRGSLWAELLRMTSLPQLKSVVRGALLSRNPERARMPSRRFAIPRAALARGR